AAPPHGSAPLGGATACPPPILGAARALAAGVLCEPVSAHKAYHWGMITEIAPALKVDGKFVANPLVETQRYADEYGRIVFGDYKTGEAAREGKALLARGTVDLSILDERVEALSAKLLLTFPDCTTKTIEELRKPKLEAWTRNKENHRAWLALNMMTEARAGFRAFNEGTREDREIDFIALRQAIASGEGWSDALTERLLPGKKR
ncbi:MAG: 6-oxocyclohex-1-ene-1-carbonyl-CoA hydratase, partial [Burkholderiales bacterium]|nr:6-oxocyclohex-1-ene-1-carbonyl-CoA hydratase [Burkholderiales bacterium]